MARKTTLSLIAGALAMGIAPDPVVSPVAWAKTNLIVADGPHAGHKWDDALTPYLPDILDCLAPDHPCTRVSVRKSAQTGLSQLGIVWTMFIVACAPAKAMVVFPTISSVQDFNREKLTPTIESTRCLRNKVREQRSRSAQGSTALNKRFPGGSLILTGANSSADLRSKTVKFLFCDEIDEWPFDLDGQGDPMEMADARQIAFHTTGEYKKFECSTPTIKGVSRIDASFEAGDQRYFQVPCPHCGEYQRLVFKNLMFDKVWPFNARYACAHCGSLIEHHHKRAMVQAGKWVAACPGPGRHPSFHIDALTSLLTTWDKLAEKFLSSKDDPQKLKAFVNLWLGEAWEERGEAPEWQRLFARREDYRPRSIPMGGLILTCFTDVQANGLFYETVAWGKGKASWSIDIGFLPGETADPAGPVWRALEEVYERRYVDAYGVGWTIDLMAVDSGFNTGAVYEWVRRRPKAMATKGMPGWYHPPLGTPSKQDVTFGGRKLRRGLLLWPIGTWPLKAELYAALRKDGRRDGAEEDPPGYCHFTEALHDDGYFKQLTAEHLKDREVKGRTVREWVASGDNHYHDCRIGNMALAEHLGVGRMTDDDWARLAAQRNVPPRASQGDLLAMMTPAVPAQAEDRAEPENKTMPQPAAARQPVAGPPRRRGFVNGWRG
ncbi:putative Prophage LambdaW4, terminase large subunit [Magnetospirillum sp. XM-1]|uniref:phage terminase large subunit family protein n=1 Tax=Magnetospirillum sp. XM-1 TaxID=1663591 RepID=UPI00073DE728|nr:terminase gpA endonuclease subunit [Magnetospirillum sp. XM-1]CUW39683.1 putative Prophage LambdaW4, terminase large subunit [Magnetospirillum sp. XM-1]